MYLRFFAVIKTYEALLTDSNSDKDFFDEVLTMSVVDCLQVLNVLNLFYLHASIQHTKTEVDSYIANNVMLHDIFADGQFQNCCEKFDIQLKDNSNVTGMYNIFTSHLDLQQLKKKNCEKSLLYFIDTIASDEDLLEILYIEDSLFIFNRTILKQIITNIQKNIFQELLHWQFYEEKDKVFFNTIIKHSIGNKVDIDSLLTKYSINWGADRFFLIDKVLISLAYSEMKYITTPRTVVINEYVNLAKMFNDDKSSRFVNAILDKILGS